MARNKKRTSASKARPIPPTLQRASDFSEAWLHAHNEAVLDGIVDDPEEASIYATAEMPSTSSNPPSLQETWMDQHAKDMAKNKESIPKRCPDPRFALWDLTMKECELVVEEYTKFVAKAQSEVSVATTELTDRPSSENFPYQITAATATRPPSYEWTRSWKKPEQHEAGLWLCSRCERFLDQDSPEFKDRDEVLAAHQKLGIWPPFQRQSGVPLRQRNCRHCHRSRFCKMFSYFEHDFD